MRDARSTTLQFTAGSPTRRRRLARLRVLAAIAITVVMATALPASAAQSVAYPPNARVDGEDLQSIARRQFR